MEKGESITVRGNYTNRDGNKVFFEEYHRFDKDQRHVLLIVREDGKPLAADHLSSFKAEVLK